MGSKPKKLAEATIYNIIIVTLISTVLVSTFILVYSSRRISEVNVDQNKVLTAAINYQIETFVKDQVRIMDEFVLFYNFNKNDDNQRRLYYKELMELQPEFSRFLVIGPTGQVEFTYPNDELLVGTDHGYYTYFLEAKQDVLHWSDTFYDVINNLPRVALSIKVDDKVLVAYIDLVEINNFIGKLDIRDNSIVSILDTSGTYIAHNSIEKVIQREKDKDVIELFNRNSDLSEIVMSETSMYLQFVQRISIADWVVLIRQSKAPVRTLQRDIIFITSTLLSGLIFVFIMVSIRRMRRIRKSFDHFTDNLLVLSKGDYGHRVEKAEYLEFDVLGHEFNKMAESIQLRENTIHDLNADLENKVEERTKLLDESNQELRTTLENLQETQEKLIISEKMASIGQVVAGVAHEINTPVGISVTMASYIDVQTKKIHEEFNENKLGKKALNQYFEEVSHSSGIMLNTLERASELIRSFKQVAVDQSSIDKVIFDPCDIVKSVVTSLKVQADRQNVSIHYVCDVNRSVISWPGRLSQIAMNLIQNAINHGFKALESGAIDVTLQMDEYGVVLIVKDNGHGIPEDQLDKIYEPFFTTGRLEGSTGLGLNIVHNLVESAYEGKIQCFTEHGKGTTFVLQLPMAFTETFINRNDVSTEEKEEEEE